MGVYAEEDAGFKSNSAHSAIDGKGGMTANSKSAENDKDILDSQPKNRSWWRHRTSLEKALIVMLFIAAIIAIAMSVIAATRTGRIFSNGYCTSQDCIRTAARLLDTMDSSVDPCDDFFEFACGSWNRKNVIPDDKPNYNTFAKLRDELQLTLKGLLEEPVTDDDALAIQNAKNFYKSCLNISLINSRGDEPLLSLIDQLGEWPVRHATWNELEFDWVELMARLRLLNHRVFINQWVNADDKNSTVNIIQMDQMQLGMPSRDYYLKQRDAKPLMAYQKLATDLAILLGADPERAEREMQEMVNLEIRLANITVADELRRDTEALYHRYTVAELYTKVTPKIDWLKYMTLLFNNVSFPITEDEEVVLYATDYMKHLAEVIATTSNRTIANYMMWRIVHSRITSMPQRYLDLLRDYNKAIFGTDSERARWRVCVDYVNDNFGMAVGRMFVERHFDERAKTSALEMIDSIRDAFNELVEKVSWMDTDTRKVARLKAEAIQEKIGYPEYVMNDTALNLDYVGIKTDPKKFFENVLDNLKIYTRNNMKTVRQPVDKSKWLTAPAVVNAFYSAPKNQIMFPAGILQPPFYHENYPKYKSFSSAGMVIGHEITHGFDDRGRLFDKDGNLKQWWSHDVIKRFKEKAQCIIDQYSNYTVEEVNTNLNGRQTQGENIADNGGLKQAFRAYRKWVEQQGHEEDLLIGIDLNHNQLFFLNFAQIWCGTSRPESYIQAIRSGRHSPGKFRVIGSLSNSEEFAKAYNCPVGSKMNPVKKCVVW